MKQDGARSDLSCETETFCLAPLFNFSHRVAPPQQLPSSEGADWYTHAPPTLGTLRALLRCAELTRLGIVLGEGHWGHRLSNTVSVVPGQGLEGGAVSPFAVRSTPLERVNCAT